MTEKTYREKVLGLVGKISGDNSGGREMINDNGEMTEVGFWPADEIAAAFERVNAAMGKENETEAMRLFVRAMNYFYEHSETSEGSVGDNVMTEICRLARKGLHAELGITAPEGKPE